MQEISSVVVPLSREAQHPTELLTPLLEFSDLRFRYSQETPEVLKGISLKLHAGTMVLVIGPTGCGKTTAVLAMNGLVPASTGGLLDGDVLVDGRSTKKFSTAQLADTIGVVFQDPEGQMCTLFLEDEIAFGLENLRVEPDEIERRVAEMLDFIGLKHLVHKSLFELSGGQKQKVNFASVLAMRPRLLVADMPTANLDPIGSEDVFVLLRNLARSRDTTCVIVENRVDELAPLADRVIVMCEGQIRYDGTPAEIFGDHGKTLRDDIGVEIPQVVEIALALRNRGCDIGVPLTIDETVSAIMKIDQRTAFPVSMPLSPPEKKSKGDELIRVEDVIFSYPDGTRALKGLSSEMARGEVLAIIGNNGSGKTTLAKLLAGLLRPSTGSIRIAGLDTSKVAVKDIAKKVSYIFQYPDQQFVTQLVFDEVAFNLRNVGMPEDEVNARVKEILDKFQLSEFAEKSPFMLSGGEMRTLSVACMLTLDPEIIILDEPTYGQDRIHVRALMERLEEQRAKGTSTILITHDMRLVAEYVDHVLVMNDGKLLFDGLPSDLFYQPTILRQASLKEPPVCTIITKLVEAGFSLPKNIISIEGLLAALDLPDQRYDIDKALP